MSSLACTARRARERGNEQTCRSNKTPCDDDDDDDEDQPTDRHSIMCGRGLHKSDKNQRQRATTQTKGILAADREGREEERAMERRKERDAAVKKMNQSERIKTRGAHVRACGREKTHNRDLRYLPTHCTDNVILNECE